MPAKTEIPPDAEEIHPGYHLHAQPEQRRGYGWQVPDEPDTNRWVFTLYFPNGDKRDVATVNLPMTKTMRTRDDRPDAALISARVSTRDVPDEVVHAISNALFVSASFATVLNESYEDELTRQQNEYDKYQQELKLARQRDDEQYNELFQKVVWLVDSKFRLKRRGKKATVFGTIKYVTPPREDGSAPPGAYMETISEKGVPMTIRLRDVIWMEIKHDDSSRRYDNIYTEKLREED